MAYSLKYSYNSSSQSYTVTGYSNITTSDKVVIPSTYDDGTNGEHPVTSISSSAFNGCSSLTSVTIPDSVTFIGWKAFNGCSSLTSVTIPDGVTSIEVYAFYECSSLKQLILFPSTPPTLGSGAIPYNVQSIYVQQSSKTAYQAATNWNGFASKIVGDNIYLSFVRFNQKNKEYIEKKLNDFKGDKGDLSADVKASLAKADSSLQKPTATLAKESFVKVGIDGTQKFDESSYVVAPSTGGTAGQVLKKTATGTEWADESGGGVDNKTITKTPNEEIQAVALTNGTDLLTYAERLQATTIERL